MAALSPEDIDDWRKGVLRPENLRAFARFLVQQMEMEEGKRDDSHL